MISNNVGQVSCMLLQYMSLFGKKEESLLLYAFVKVILYEEMEKVFYLGNMCNFTGRKLKPKHGISK